MLIKKLLSFILFLYRDPEPELLAEIKKYVDEVYRVLKPNGKFIYVIIKNFLDFNFNKYYIHKNIINIFNKNIYYKKIDYFWSTTLP